MAENKHSSDGIAEDLIRAFVQIGCAENHAKTLLEKAQSEIEEGIIDVTNQSELEKSIAKVNELTDETNRLADLRRKMMLKLKELYPDGDASYWCMVKHLGIGAYTAWEVYQASEDDPDFFNLSIEANKAFLRALSRFIGVDVVECAACFADLIKAKGENKNGES